MPFGNILDFVESPRGLNRFLLPVQRFILKLHYGTELDATEPRIHIFDHLQERYRYSLTEVDYLTYLYGEGRCSVSDQSTLPRPGLVLAAGRRTGKTALAEMIACYTVIQMLQVTNPHGAFGYSDCIALLEVVCICPNEETRHRYLDGLSEYIARCQDLHGSMLLQNSTGLTFLTEAGRRSGLIQGNLTLSALTSRSRTNGSRKALLIFDELARMSNEQDVHDANFSTLLPQGRYATLGTPRRAEGAFYNQFRHAMGNGPEAPLALQIPTWEVQPAMGPFLRQRFEESPTHFYIEYGAHWDRRGIEGRGVRIELRV